MRRYIKLKGHRKSIAVGGYRLREPKRDMRFEDYVILNVGTGTIILILIVLANFYQRRIMKRFSGVIGKIMSWYSLGLFTFLLFTIFAWVVNIFDLDSRVAEIVGRLFFIVAIVCFLKGARVIR